MSGFISEWGGGGGAFPFSISDLYRIKTKVLWSSYTYPHSFQPEVFAEGSIPWERLIFCFGLLTSFCFGFGEFQIIPESTFGNQGYITAGENPSALTLWAAASVTCQAIAKPFLNVSPGMCYFRISPGLTS